MMNFISDVFELIFWLFLIIAVWKYDAFGKLPVWLQITLYGSVGLSGVFGLIHRWF